MDHLDQLDKLDIKILKILQEDGRANHSEIARKLDVGHTRVRDHVMRMEAAGIIEGYGVFINPMKLGFTIQCFVHVEVDQERDFNQLIQQLLEMDEIVEIINITGEYDVILRAWLRDTIHFRHFLYDKISLLPAHKRTISNIVLGREAKPLGLDCLESENGRIGD